jgi:hypothetical protein
MSESNWVTLEDCTIVKITEKAILINREDWDDPIWFPKTCIEDPDRFDEGDSGMTVLITRRIASEKGIEE